MKHLLKIIIISLAVPVLFSCSKEFFNTKETGVMSEDTYYNSMDNILMAVNGVYGSLNTQSAGIHNIDIMYLTFGSIASDDAEAGGEQGGNDFLDIQDADKGTVQPTEPKAQSQEYYAYSYKTILRANSVLAGIDKYLSNNSVAADSAQLLNRYKGEMKFIIALMHFRLVQVYGGVPIIDKVLGSSDYTTKIVRNPIGDCMHFIEQQLKEAANLLPWSYAPEEVGRATKGAALSFLAKAYLYEASYGENYPGDSRFGTCNNTYNLAAQYADSVINSGQYELVGIDGSTFDTYWNTNTSTLYPTLSPGYRYIFTVEGENSKESIFEIQSVNDKQAYMVSRGTYLTVYMACRNTSSGGLGWGFNCPTEDLLAAYDPIDPRKIVSIGTTGDPILIATGNYPNLKYKWVTLDCHQCPTNMISRKWEASPAQYWNNKTTDINGPNDFYYMRYGDLVLMAAEAAIKAGIGSLPLSGKTPLQLVNDIRKRARNGASTGVPADLTSIDFEGIVKERRLELALEGHRFFDLVRWKKQEILTGMAMQNWLGGVHQNSPGAICQFTAGKNDFFPIPLVEIVNSNGTLKQYDGW